MSISWTTVKNAIATWVRTASGLPADRIWWAGQNAPEPEGSTTLPWILIGRPSLINPGSDWSDYEDNPLTFDPKIVTLDASTDTGTSTAHDLQTRDGPIQLMTTGSLAGTGLAVSTDYWTIQDDDDTLKFATSFANADAGTFIDITGVGVGVHTIVHTEDTRRAGEELFERARGARNLTLDIQCFPPQPAIGTVIPDDSDTLAILSTVSAKASLGTFATALCNAGIGMLDPGTPRPVDGVLNSVYFEPRAIMTVVFTTTSEVTGFETVVDTVNVDEDPGTTDFTVNVDTPPNDP